MLVFLCEHGAAKSIVAAAYFNKLARDSGLRIHAIARGTDPDTELSPNAVAGLQADGLISTESVPQKLSLAEVETAQQIVTFCEIPGEYRGNTMIEQWDGVPAVSEDYEKARDVIIEKIKQLIENIMLERHA